MLEYYFKRPRVQARVKTNVLYKQIKKLIYYLHDCGYQPETIQSYVQKVEHFGIWLKANGIKASSVNKDTIVSFLDGHLPNCSCELLCSRHRKDVCAALNRLLRILPPQDQRPRKIHITPVEKEIQRFKTYMNDVCGLSSSTVRYRVRNTTEFLADIFGNRQIKYQNITPHRILKYVSKKAKQYKPGSTKVLTCSLRCYFRFLQFEGKCSHNLIGAVPIVPNWKLSTLPKTMSKEQLSKFLASFDRKTPSGQRDYAIALCFLELGIRAFEVKDLLLDEIDWENSTVNIRASKTSQSRILPLPVRLGRALACYLKNGRSKTDSRNVFIRHSVPKGKPVTIYIVRGAMRRAHERAGLSDQFTGTHVFRHTLATTMHQKGATLKEVADNGLRPRTYATLFGLIACAGLRISEALKLSRNDVDLVNGIVLIAETKFHKSRLVPLDPSASKALRKYAKFRDQYHPAAKSKSFFSLRIRKLTTLFHCSSYFQITSRKNGMVYQRQTSTEDSGYASYICL